MCTYTYLDYLGIKRKRIFLCWASGNKSIEESPLTFTTEVQRRCVNLHFVIFQKQLRKYTFKKSSLLGSLIYLVFPSFNRENNDC